MAAIDRSDMQHLPLSLCPWGVVGLFRLGRGKTCPHPPVHNEEPQQTGAAGSRPGRARVEKELKPGENAHL